MAIMILTFFHNMLCDLPMKVPEESSGILIIDSTLTVRKAVLLKSSHSPLNQRSRAALCSTSFQALGFASLQEEEACSVSDAATCSHRSSV